MVLDLEALKKFANLIVQMHEQVPTLPAVVSMEERRAIKVHLERLGFHINNAIDRIQGQEEAGEDTDEITRLVSDTLETVNKILINKTRAEMGNTIIDQLKKQAADA